MKFLGCLFVLLFLGLFLMLAAAKSVLSFLFGPQRPKDTTRQSQRNTQGGQPHAKSTHSPKKQGKIFDKSEGEYVDFEEIKK